MVDATIRTLRFIILVIGLPVIVLTTVMSYDASRINIDFQDMACNSQTIVQDDEVLVTFPTNVKYNGHVFSFYDMLLKIDIFDADDKEDPIGVGETPFQLKPGDVWRETVNVKIRREAYDKATSFLVGIKVDGSLALDYPPRTLKFVTFNLNSTTEVIKDTRAVTCDSS